jgi:small subunit ribosomal protein S9
MASGQPSQLLNPFRGICGRCRQRTSQLRLAAFLQAHHPQRKAFSTTRPHNDELEAYVEAESAAKGALQITAAPKINLETQASASNFPARIIPASPSYFTASPQFNDDVLLLRSLVRELENLPTVSSDQTPHAAWLKLATYRSRLGEPVSSAKYSKVLQLLSRLNKIHPKLQTKQLHEVLNRFRRPDVVGLQKPPPRKLDDEGRAHGMGRRKESVARVKLIEGNGEVLINGRSVVQAFPRLHDRESALWALKVTGRMDKYNVFAIVTGGGLTGQAESVTLAVARALMVHEPALKPTLRKGERISLPLLI